MSIKFEFDRLTRTYSPGQEVTVNCEVSTKEPIKWKEAYCNAYCVRTVNSNGHGLNGFDQPIPHGAENTLWSTPLPVRWPISIENGFKFQIKFKVPSAKALTESIRGKYVSVDYLVEVQIKRGMFTSDMIFTKTFYVVFPAPEKRPTGDPIEITMDRKDLKKGSPPVDFQAKVHLDTPVASFKRPPKGWIKVLKSNQPITAITVSYMRTETIFSEKGGSPSVFVSEVCRMQIAENDPVKNIEIPFNLEWVRILVSPDLETPQFSMNIGLKIRILFDNEGYANHVIPLKLCRDMPY